MIQIHRLEGFYRVAKTGGYARAARAFPYPITQPAVHQQVKKLERELDLELFERLGKDKLGMTPAGKALFEFAAPFFEGLPGVLRSIRAADYVGELKIHAETLLLRHLLPGWLKRLKKQMPELVLDLHEIHTANTDALRRGETDVVIAHLPDIPDDIATMTVAMLKPYIVLPRDHPIADRKRIPMAKLADDTFVAYHREMLPHAQQMAALEAHGLEPENIMTAGSADTILGFVESGLGYSLVPWLGDSGPKVKGVVSRPLTRPKVEFPVVIAWRKDTPENPFLDAILSTAPKP